MAILFKKLWSKLDLPTNDWVLSRFGSFERPTEATVEPAVEEEPAPTSRSPASVAARLFDHWFDHGPADDSSPPQSGDRMSLIASGEAEAMIPPEHKSRAS